MDRDMWDLQIGTDITNLDGNDNIIMVIVYGDDEKERLQKDFEEKKAAYKKFGLKNNDTWGVTE